MNICRQKAEKNTKLTTPAHEDGYSCGKFIDSNKTRNYEAWNIEGK